MFIFYLTFLAMFKIIPILPSDTSSDDPPYEKNGKVIPVTGKRPITTAMLSAV